MKLRSGLAVISIVAITTSLALFTAQGAAKAGTVCKKAGTQEVVKNKRYTCIKSGRKLIWNAGVTVTPTSAPEKPNGAPTPTPVATPVDEPAKYLSSAEPLDTCRVPDSRTTKVNASEAIAYPVTSGGHPNGIPTTGVINVAVIPIDFSDVPGQGSPSTIIDPEIEQSIKWINHFSNGKTTYKFQTSTKWIRASKSSDNYEWTHPGSQGNPLAGAKIGPQRTATQIATDLMADAQNSFDYKNLNIVFFVYPKNVLNIWDAVTAFSPIQTNVGLVNIQVNASGAWLYTNNFPIWAWFIHENMHPTGLAGHAPSDGSPFGIMTNQAGASLVLDAWDQSILDWQRDNEIYCISKENIADNEIPLNSIDNNSNEGTKSIFIRLSSHEVLVIESRRKSEWSSGWLGFPGLPDGFAGLLVYKVDTSVDRNRVESEGGFAVYQKMVGVNNGKFQGAYSPEMNLNILIKAGQSMVTNGVKIELIKSISYDTVRISKNN
jgi:hypothetical protein